MMADLPSALGASEGEIVGYADDVAVTCIGDNVAEVKRKLSDMASKFAAYAGSNGLVMNTSKTQLLWVKSPKLRETYLVSNDSGGSDDLSIQVEGETVRPTNTFEILGISVDRNLRFLPYELALETATKHRVALISRLSCHIPRGPYLSCLAKGIFLGKVAYGLAATAAPRLHGTEPASSRVQKNMNMVARTITGTNRKDHVKVVDLLNRANLLSFNSMAVKAVAMLAWKAFHLRDGPGGSRSPLGCLLFGDSIDGGSDSDVTSRSSRSASAGRIKAPTRLPANTTIHHAAVVWNSCASLREAKTIREASRAALELAKSSPI